MVTTSGLRVPAKECRQSRLPRKKGLLWRLLAGLRLLLVLLLWVSTLAASCVRVINSITARSTIFSRTPGIVSAQPITAPVFNSSPPPRTLIVVTATPLGCATGLSGRRVLADATSKNPPDEGHGFSRATLRHRMRASVSSGPSSLTKDGWP